MSHWGGGGEGLKSAEKVSRIIWMAPKSLFGAVSQFSKMGLKANLVIEFQYQIDVFMKRTHWTTLILLFYVVINQENYCKLKLYYFGFWIIIPFC